MTQNLIAAIEIGSQQVSAVIGRREPDGAVHVMAAAQEPSAKFVQRGKVLNPDLMTQCLRSLIEKLENQSRKAVNQVFVGVGGMGLRSVLNQVTRNYGEPTKITQEIVDSILDENRSLSIPSYRILDVLPLEYKLGVQSQTDPVGIVTNKVVGNFLDLIVPNISHEQLENSLRAADIHTAATLVSPLYLANQVLSDAEKLSGCAYVDMGAETTTVGIFESKLLRFLAVIPLGGANVTRDLMTVLSIEEQEAEELKRRYGKAYVEASEGVPVGHDNIRLKDGRSIPYEQIVGIVEARMSEILQNVAHLIKDVGGYAPDRLIGGMVVTGGASNMAVVDKALIEYTQIRKLRFVKNIPLSIRTGQKLQNFNIDGSYNTVLSFVATVDEDCCSDERRTPDIFENQAQEEEQERLRKEEEARQAEEQARLQQEEEEKRKREEAAQRRRNGVSKVFGSLRKSLEKMFTVEEEDQFNEDNNA